MIRLRRAGTGAAAAPVRMRIVERLAALHGLPQKIGQILSLGELRTGEHGYSLLTEGCQGLPPDIVFREIETALGRPIRQCYSYIEEEGTAASLGQVHRAWLHDGREVAVKVQLPGIADALETDLLALGWLTLPVGGLGKGFDLAGYRKEVGTMLRQEVDYIHEASMIQHFSTLTKNVEGVEVPDVIAEFSCDRVLTMTWLHGEPFQCIRKWDQDARRATAERLVELFLTGIFRWGLLHADPHPGNYRFSLREGRPVVGLLDFGCVKFLPPATTVALAAIIDDVKEERLRQSPELAQFRFEELGFKRQLLEPMSRLLPPLASVLFQPFVERKEFSPLQGRLSERVQEILGAYRWNFRMAGPPDLIFFLRAYQGLLQYLDGLEAPVDWYRIYERVRPGRSLATLPSRYGTSLRPKPGHAQFLRIRVSQGEQTKAEFTFLAHAAENLADLVPPEIEGKLTEMQIDIGQLARDAVRAGFPPGDMFQLEEGEKKVRIWLE